MNTELEAIIGDLAQFDSATISNAIEPFKVRDRTEGYASMELKCQFPSLPPMVGFAITCTMDSTTPGRPHQTAERHELFNSIESSPKPVVLVAKDVGSDHLRSCFFGDMFCAALKALGAIGVVTDGGVRDLSGTSRNAPGFHVFAPGTVASHGNIVRFEFDVPVTVGGMEVRPGDILHGDENGIVKVPLEIASDVAEEAGRVRRRESEYFHYLSGQSVTRDGIEKLL